MSKKVIHGQDQSTKFKDIKNLFNASFGEKYLETTLKKHAEKLKKQNDVTEEFNEIGHELGEFINCNSSAIYFEENADVFIASNSKEFGQLSSIIASDLINEFKPRNTIEKLLCKSISVAYIKYLSFTRGSININNKSTISQLDINLSKVQNNNAQRAYKEYIEGIKTLQSLRQPPLKVNIKTDNAFIANNQEINNENK